MDALEELTGNVSRYPHTAMGRVGIAEFSQQQTPRQGTVKTLLTRLHFA
jgi:hypothetical protein